MASTLVYFIRHGQTMENRQRIIQGQQDTQLDEVGIAQAVSVGQALKDVNFDIAFTSDLSRAVDTATAILRHHSGIPLQKLSLLRERHMGNLQGHQMRVGMKRPPLDHTAETSEAFVERILQFWDQCVIPHARETHCSSGRPSCMLIVSHGAYIATLARALIVHRGIVESPEVVMSWCPNTSITLFEVHIDGTGSLLKFGDTSHYASVGSSAKPTAVRNVDELTAVNTHQ